MTGNKTVYAGWQLTGVPDWLSGKEHFAYMVGYTDGTVRPLNNTSRAEVAAIFFRLLDEDIRAENLTAAGAFGDVSEGMWCNTAVSTMAKLGVVNGRTAEHFDPDALLPVPSLRPSVPGLIPRRTMKPATSAALPATGQKRRSSGPPLWAGSAAIRTAHSARRSISPAPRP